jgi:hypothetical protein
MLSQLHGSLLGRHHHSHPAELVLLEESPSVWSNLYCWLIMMALDLKVSASLTPFKVRFI